MIISVAALVAALGGFTPVGAEICETARCTCVVAPAPEVALRAAESVFLGSVTGVRETTLRMEGLDLGIPAREVTFRLHAAWKGVGAAESTVSVTTGHGDGDCGVAFEVGTVYLVYAQRAEGGGLSTSICSRTATAAAAQADFDALGHPPLVRHR